MPVGQVTSTPVLVLLGPLIPEASLAPSRTSSSGVGVGGHLAPQILATLEDRAMDFDPDLVLFCLTQYSASEILAPLDAATKKTFNLKRRTYPFFHSYSREVIRSRIRATMRTTQPLTTSSASQSASDATGPAASPVLDRLLEISQGCSVPCVVVLLNHNYARPSPTSDDLARQASLRGLYFLDTAETFNDTRVTEMQIHELDYHPNAEAHQRFAWSIRDFLSTVEPFASNNAPETFGL